MSGSRRRAALSVVRPAPDGGAQSEATVRGLCREARALTSALEMECWISSLLGQLWEQRDQAPPLELDPAFVLGAPFAEQIARSGIPGARLAMQAIACVDRGGLGVRCAQLADGLAGEPLPTWARRLGGVRVRRALTAGVPGDGEVLCLEAGGGGRWRRGHGRGVRPPATGLDRQVSRRPGGDRRLGLRWRSGATACWASLGVEGAGVRRRRAD